MAENDTLLAHLVPALTPQVEPAATRALAYILNKSNSAMEAFNTLVRKTTGQPLETLKPVSRVNAEVAYLAGNQEQGRMDLVGYDSNQEKRVIVEAKFAAPLSRGQGNGYLSQLSNNGKSVLMFLVPDYRIEYLWGAVESDIGKGNLEPLKKETQGSIRAAPIPGSDSFLMMVSWRDLLETIEQTVADDAGTTSDVKQLRGLTENMDMEAFSPIKKEELGAEFASRIMGYTRLIDVVVDARGTREKWMSTQGLRATPQWYGYGRYFNFPGVSGDFWFGVNFERWSKNGMTPLWVNVANRVNINMAAVDSQLNVVTQGRWIPIVPRVDADYQQVLEDVVDKLKRIRDIVGLPSP